MSAHDRERWTEKHAQCEPLSVVQPDEWLVEALQLIERAADPAGSGKRVLDVACGLGHNAIWLAQQQWQTDAVDISSKGIELARRCASANGAEVSWIEADLDDWIPAAHSYDLVTVFRFLDRVTVPRLVRTALRTNGWLVYETFAAGQLARPGSHIRNPAFTLSPGELPLLFPDFEVVVHREDNLHDRTVQRLLARRRALPTASPP